MGHKKYRAAQLADWLFKRGVRSFAEMSNMPAGVRAILEEKFTASSLVMLKKQVSAQEGTAKYLFELRDGQAVETVLMKYRHGNSACLSTQAGCRMGCRLCASALGGLVRNLTPGEMYDQVLLVQQDSGERVSHLVLMGTGEPLDNMDNTIIFLRHVTSEYGLNISFRHITLSTCGLVPQIRKLAALKLPLTLAVSLHAPEDTLRSRLLPVNNKYPLGELMEACRYYTGVTGRRITFEYAMLAGLNDSPEQAAKLAALVRGILCHINLIPYNQVAGKDYAPSSDVAVSRFKSLLESLGVAVTVRRKMGADIDAACGQLRRAMTKGPTGGGRC